MEFRGKVIAPGEEARLEISIAKLPTHTEVTMPIHIYRSENPGPVLLLTAGIHGDELNGTESIRRMVMAGELKPEAGSVVAIPMVNVYGFLHRSRTFPDGRDLNRSFPGGKSGSLARRVAGVLMQELIPQVDLGVDFHTGGDQISNYPQVRCVFKDKENLELAQKFGAPLILNSSLIDKSFRKEAYKAGKRILVYEGGQALRLDELAIEEGRAGVRRLMNALGMRAFEQKESANQVIPSSTWIRARIAGIAVPQVSYGQIVRAGHVLFTLGDPYGEMLHEVKAPSDGIIIGINRNPVVNVGNALCHLGKLE